MMCALKVKICLLNLNHALWLTLHCFHGKLESDQKKQISFKNVSYIDG